MFGKYRANLLQASAPSPLFFFLLCLSLSKTGVKLSLSLSRPTSHHHRRPPFWLLLITISHAVDTSNSSIISGEVRGDDRHDGSSPCNVTAGVPTPIPATTGHHSRRDNDQKNPLEVLYTTVFTGTRFSILENPVTVHRPCILHAGSESRGLAGRALCPAWP